MKRKLWALLLLSAMILLAVAALAEDLVMPLIEEPKHVHICSKDGICPECKQAYGEDEDIIHQLRSSTEYGSDGENHWFYCNCEEPQQITPHKKKCNESNCSACGTKYDGDNVEHVGTLAWDSDADNHWKTCSVCDRVSELGSHSADCRTKRCNTCSAPCEGSHLVHGADVQASSETQHWMECGYCHEVHSVKENHTSSGYQSDDSEHYRVCAVCGETYEKGAHHTSDGGENGPCAVCGKMLGTAEPDETDEPDNPEETTPPGKDDPEETTPPDPDDPEETTTPGTDEPGDSETTPPPSGTDEPDETVTPGGTDEPDETDKPDVTDEPDETEKPDVTDEPDETDKPDVTDEPDETDKPDVTDEPDETEKPDVTDEPDETEKPDATDEPDETDRPDVTDEPDETEKPDATDEPDETDRPDATDEPDETPAPDGTEEPDASATPEATDDPDATETPEGTVQPGKTAALGTADDGSSFLSRFQNNSDVAANGDLLADLNETVTLTMEAEAEDEDGYAGSVLTVFAAGSRADGVAISLSSAYAPEGLLLFRAWQQGVKEVEGLRETTAFTSFVDLAEALVQALLPEMTSDEVDAIIVAILQSGFNGALEESNLSDLAFDEDVDGEIVGYLAQDGYEFFLVLREENVSLLVREIK